MATQKLHLHSMIVHVVAALSPVAAIAYIFFSLQLNFLSFDQATWSYLVYLSIIIMLLAAIPSVLTGVFERNHIYAKWHSTHKVKLILSLLLVPVLGIELLLLHLTELESGLWSLTGGLIVIVNNIILFLLGKYGLKITLGRQSLGRASYVPDLMKPEPIDILVTAAAQRKEEPKYIDLLTER